MENNTRRTIIVRVLILIVQTLCIVALSWFLWGSNANAYSIKLNESEQALMTMAYREGKHLDKPEILQAILLNETVAGRFGRIGDAHFKNWRKRSYGVMQIQFNTARRILNSHGLFKHWTNEKLLIYLRGDDRFNMYVSRLIVQQLWNRYKDWDYVLLAYNVGTWNIGKHGLEYDPNGYLARAYFHITSTIKEFNSPFKYQEMLVRMSETEVQRLLKDNNEKSTYHKVKRGDTLSKLALHYFGDIKRWTEVQKLNPLVIPTNMKIGSTLLIRR
jgi:hypothetical protein